MADYEDYKAEQDRFFDKTIRDIESQRKATNARLAAEDKAAVDKLVSHGMATGLFSDKDTLRARFIESLKSLVYHGYEQYLGQYWRPNLMAMENHQNGKSTDLVFSEWTFDNGFADGEFTPSRLRRGR